MAKKLLTRSVGALAITLLAACGQKGPLYIPAPPAASAPAPAASTPLKP